VNETDDSLDYSTSGDDSAHDAARAQLSAIGDIRAYELLASAGVNIAPTIEVRTREETIEAAQRIGYPVALKDASAGNSHKTENNALRLNLAGRAQLETAWEELSAKFDGPYLVQRMQAGIAEVIVGGVVDPNFGPHVVVGSGGIFAEVFRDAVIERAPVAVSDALKMLRRLRSYPVLNGVRGRSKADLLALSQLICAASRLIADPGTGIHEIDINPVIAGPRGAVAVDVLIVCDRSAPMARGGSTDEIEAKFGINGEHTQ
jgi:hypothetical protein